MLGIDAAWTAKNPSGVALIRETPTGWCAVAIAPSYAAFSEVAEGKRVDWAKPSGGLPDPEALVMASRRLLGGDAELAIVAVDMPLATIAIRGFRVADRLMLKAFGATGASVLPPSATMPGEISVRIRDGFVSAGFPLAVEPETANTAGRLVEVYPGAAVLRLLGANKRVPYKMSRAAKYWPGVTPAERRRKLLTSWRQIIKALDRHINGIGACLPELSETGSGAAMKSYEDGIDAMIAAWVGSLYLTGKVTSYGDETAAIWVP